MNKLQTLLQSRKFWVLVASVVAIASGYYQNQIDFYEGLTALVAAGAAFSIGTGIESGLGKMG